MLTEVALPSYARCTVFSRGLRGPLRSVTRPYIHTCAFSVSARAHLSPKVHVNGVTRCASFVHAVAQVLLLQYASQVTERKRRGISGGRGVTIGGRATPYSTLNGTASGGQWQHPIGITDNDNPSVPGNLLLAPVRGLSGEASRSGPIGSSASSAISARRGRVSAGAVGVGAAGATRGGLLEAKVVARALCCLEALCRNPDCEVFMTPLAREVINGAQFSVLVVR